MEEKNTVVRNKKCFNLAVEEEEDENWAALKICGRCFPEILLFSSCCYYIMLALQPLEEVAMMTLPTDIKLYTLVFSKVIELDALVVQQWCLFGCICWWVE